MVAWRRGVLSEGYPNGLRSMIRERMVLEMIDDELTAEAFRDTALMHASLLSTHSAGKPMKDLQETLAARLSFSYDKREYIARKFREISEQSLDFADKAIELYKRLKASGAIEAFDKACDKIYNSRGSKGVRRS